MKTPVRLTALASVAAAAAIGVTACSTLPDLQSAPWRGPTGGAPVPGHASIGAASADDTQMREDTDAR